MSRKLRSSEGWKPEAGSKPRKPKEDTLAYVSSFLGEDAQVASNVAAELRYEVASVASDHRGGELLERLGRACPGRVVEAMLRWCGPYAGFLARHRHGSHVIQSLLAMATTRGEAQVEFDDDDDDNGDDESALGVAARDAEDRGVRCAARFLRDWGDDWRSAVTDWNASHPLRAALWALVGLPVIIEGRGRRSKHGHSIDDAVHRSNRDLIQLARQTKQSAKLGRTAFTDAIVDPLLADVRSLQAACVDASGAPTVALLLRVTAILARADDDDDADLPEDDALVLLGGPSLCCCDRITKFLLEGLPEDDKTRSAAVVYGLSFDERGSVVMEAMAKTCSNEIHGALVDLVLDSKVSPAGSIGIGAYVEGPSSNYVVQALIRTTRSSKCLKKFALAIQSKARLTLRADRAGLASALVETARRLLPRAKEKTAEKILGAIKALVPLQTDQGDLYAYVVNQDDAVREHATRAVTGRLLLDDDNSGDDLAAIFLRLLRDGAPWSANLVDAVLQTKPTVVTFALDKMGDHLLDLVADAETKHGNAASRIFLPESHLDDQLKRKLLQRLTASDDLRTRAPNFTRLLNIKRKQEQRSLTAKRKQRNPPPSSKPPLTAKIHRITKGQSTAALVAEFLQDDKPSSKGHHHKKKVKSRI